MSQGRYQISAPGQIPGICRGADIRYLPRGRYQVSAAGQISGICPGADIRYLPEADTFTICYNLCLCGIYATLGLELYESSFYLSPTFTYQ